mmetsp:Transcript_3666/g.6426  ORF Transcript_3666/g.6426 Transcript_3666/m.6426 type:complete len:366 (-) Transcript_3666:1311-2408(-)
MPQYFASVGSGRFQLVESLMQKRNLAVGVSLIVLVLFLFALLSHHGSTSSTESARRAQRPPSFTTPAFGHSNGIQKVLLNSEVVYHIPAVGQARAVLFIAHGCSHSAADFGRVSKSCPTCNGLPEELKMVQYALENNYAVIAMDSSDRSSKCWNLADVPEVVKVLDFFMTQEQPSLKDKKVVAIGISSGGSLLSHLVEALPLAAISVQVAHLSSHAISNLNSGSREWKHPPSLLIYMQSPAAKTTEIETLRQNGIQAEMIQAQKLPITALYFTRRISGFPPRLSRSIYTALKENAFIDEQGYLVSDPRRSDWRKIVKGALEGVDHTDTLRPDQSAISEVLNVAYCYHEITAEHMTETFEFFNRYT